ncbi:MAG: hypothetical protein U0136_15855 [Bdellovibrionota bacterium]
MFQLRDLALRLLSSVLESTPTPGDGRLVTPRCLEVMRMFQGCLASAHAFLIPQSPHLVITPDCQLKGRESYLGEGFQMPSPFVYVEDPVTGVFLGELGDRQTGTKPKRTFLTVESFEAARLMQSMDPPSKAAALAYEASAPPQSLRLVFGEVFDVDQLSLDPKVRPLLHLTFLELLVLSPTGVSRFESPPDLPSGLSESTARIRPDIDLPHELSWIQGVTSSVACAFKEIAWLRAVFP